MSERECRTCRFVQEDRKYGGPYDPVEIPTRGFCTNPRRQLGRMPSPVVLNSSCDLWMGQKRRKD